MCLVCVVLVILFVVQFVGCVLVYVKQDNFCIYDENCCGDVFIIGVLSFVMCNVIFCLGFDLDDCVDIVMFCIQVLCQVILFDIDVCFLVLVELVLGEVLNVDKIISDIDVCCVSVYFDVVCYVYVYLFFGDCLLCECVFEDCQMQMCDSYNYVVEWVVVLMFE